MRTVQRWRPAAQSAMIGYKQLKLNEESLESGLTLLNAVYQSTQNQAANGLATQESGSFRETAVGVYSGDKADIDSE